MRTKITLSVDRSVAEEAKRMGMNMSRVAEGALLEAIKAEKNKQWREQNQTALRAYAEEVERDGLPLEGYRLF